MLFAMCFKSAGEVGGTRLLKNVFFLYIPMRTESWLTGVKG